MTKKREQINCVVREFQDIKHTAFGSASPPTIKYPNLKCLGSCSLTTQLELLLAWGYLPHHFFNLKNCSTLCHHIQENILSSQWKNTFFAV